MTGPTVKGATAHFPLRFGSIHGDELPFSAMECRFPPILGTTGSCNGPVPPQQQEDTVLFAVTGPW